MKWLITLVLSFVFSGLIYSQNILLGTVYKTMKDKEILVKTVKKMPEQKFIDLLREDGIQCDLQILLKMDSNRRVNFATAYAQECVNRKLWLETIEVLDIVKNEIEFCVDPARFFFTKATAEFMLGKKTEAHHSLNQLSEVPDSTQRYSSLSMLMINDMETWNENDLGHINRRMREVADRLGNRQGGKVTQKLQKEILVRLDELIKEKENKDSDKGGTNDSNCPDGGKENSNQIQGNSSSNRITNPAEDSLLPSGIGRGVVDKKSDSKIVQDWGNLPEKERAEAELGLERRVPEKYRYGIRAYLKAISKKSEYK